MFRIVHTKPATSADFLPDSVRGQYPLNGAGAVPVFSDGVTVFQSLFHARRHATALPRRGRYLAALQIPDNPPVEIETWVAPGVHVIRASPELLLASVVWTTLVQ